MYTPRDLEVILRTRDSRIENLERALRDMTSNFRSLLLLVDNRESRALGLELIGDAMMLLDEGDRDEHESELRGGFNDADPLT